MHKLSQKSEVFVTKVLLVWEVTFLRKCEMSHTHKMTLATPTVDLPEVSFLARDCVRQQGSGDIGILESHTFGLHT